MNSRKWRFLGSGELRKVASIFVHVCEIYIRKLLDYLDSFLFFQILSHSIRKDFSHIFLLPFSFHYEILVLRKKCFVRACLISIVFRTRTRKERMRNDVVGTGGELSVEI